jgi:hypothetical protein
MIQVCESERIMSYDWRRSSIESKDDQMFLTIRISLDDEGWRAPNLMLILWVGTRVICAPY